MIAAPVSTGLRPNLAPGLRPVRGFEATGYAWHGERIVWAGEQARTDHPRNFHKPWQPAPQTFDPRRLHRGAACAIAMPHADTAAHPGLLTWLVGQPLPFPLEGARSRFDAVRAALEADDAAAFEAAALRVLGLGPGLTPSGDDFLGGIFFALAHAPRPAWTGRLPALQARVCRACDTATNVISAALLSDLMRGIGYRALHEALEALHSQRPAAIAPAVRALLRVGASSGADLLAGLLLALGIASARDPSVHPSP
ncbi:MAG: DUF2877 domain-containing protein [Rubrivivax sp.]|nr:DUF2877 domain-containing protein [Rubrivivax sp.]